MKDEVIQRKGCSQADNSTNRDSTKRTVPQGLRNFLEWDEKVTQMVVNFIQSQLPNVTKSETKFMEVNKIKVLCTCNRKKHFILFLGVLLRIYLDSSLFNLFLPSSTCAKATICQSANW